MKRLVIVALAAAASSNLAAQDQSRDTARDTARVTPVIVTATRVPLSRAALPVAVTVVTGEELRARGIVRVSEAIENATSAYIAQSGSPGASTSLFLRGGESKYVKVLVDGVPANDPGGAYDFASLTTDNVERIEIVRGPASVLYGADAVTGVVHVITRRGAGPASGEVELSAGMAPRDTAGTGARGRTLVQRFDATARTSGGVGAGALAGSYSVALGHHASNGLYELNNDLRDNVFSARGEFQPTSRTAARLSLRYTDHRYDYPTNGGGEPVDSNAFFADERTLLGLEVDQRLAASAHATLALTSTVNDGGTNDAVDYAGGSAYVSHDRIRRRGAELRVQLPLSWTAFALGAQLEHQDQRSSATFEFGGFPPGSSTFTADRHNLGVYGEAILTATPAVTITLGGRVDDNEQFGTFQTGRAGISWRPLAATRLRATAGSAFREPTFAENYSTGFVTGNPGLNPERARTVDAGIDQDVAGGRATLSLTGFAQRFENMIDYTGDTQSCGYSYCNVAAAESNGVEIETEARLARAFWASVGATLLHTEVLDPGFDTSSGGLYRTGESLIRRPKQKWNATLSYRGVGPLTASGRWMWVSERADRDFRSFPASPIVVPSFMRIDVGAEYAVSASARTRSAVSLRVENLLNTGYQSVFNYLAPRRTVSVGMRAKY
ncbi:MAG TPA: TonB-dependent receptor [Gemmatimonadaceae bacterium]|nr:TonB-dependent receptor [Gemmatimonadaceae bacterium]